MSNLSMNVQKFSIKGIEYRRPLPSIVTGKIRALIQSGDCPPGARLPNEMELAKAMGVSRITLRTALDALEREGLIMRRRGVGTFVTERPLLATNLEVNSGVTDLIESMGLKPGCEDLKIRMASADAHIAEQLGLAPNSSIVIVERVRTANEKPVAFSTDFFSSKLLEQGGRIISLEELRDLLAIELSIYRVFERHFGLLIDHGVAKLKPTRASKTLANKLRIPANSVMLYIEQVDFGANQQPILLSEEYHVAEVCTFTVYRRRPGLGWSTPLV